MTEYLAVPVFRSGNFDNIEDVIGRATVVTNDVDDTVEVTMHISNPVFNVFLKQGKLQALYLNAYLSNVYRAEAPVAHSQD